MDKIGHSSLEGFLFYFDNKLNFKNPHAVLVFIGNSEQTTAWFA